MDYEDPEITNIYFSVFKKWVNNGRTQRIKNERSIICSKILVHKEYFKYYLHGELNIYIYPTFLNWILGDTSHEYNKFDIASEILCSQEYNMLIDLIKN